ncbi:MAG: hypothetical protein M1136_11995 [Chloroflexi bacterium]|nr:hypothetical protein [Chloroflexota bacterium]
MRISEEGDGSLVFRWEAIEERLKDLAEILQDSVAARHIATFVRGEGKQCKTFAGRW